VGERHDSNSYGRVRGDERRVAAMIDAVFADAIEAGAVIAPAHRAALMLDARASRACVLVTLAADAHTPLLASRPMEAKELVARNGRGVEHAGEAVRLLIAAANTLLRFDEARRGPQITLTSDDIEDLAGGRTINVLAGPREQEIAVYGSDFDAAAIASLRAGRFTSVDEYTFVAA
jgi:hypothetical protein